MFCASKTQFSNPRFVLPPLCSRWLHLLTASLVSGEAPQEPVFSKKSGK